MTPKQLQALVLKDQKIVASANARSSTRPKIDRAARKAIGLPPELPKSWVFLYTFKDVA